MRIAYISTLLSAPWGGSEELWYQSAVAATDKNHQLGIFVYDWESEPLQISDLQKKGAKVYKRKRYEPFLKRGIQKLVKKLTGKGVLSKNPFYPLLRFKPDVIVITDGSTYYTVNDKDLSWMLLRYYQNKYYIISQANSYYHLPSNRQFAIEVFENASRVLFVSENNRKMACHQLAFELTKTDLIQNPLLLEYFNQIPMPPVNDTIHCALVGRYAIADKGQDILIRMLNDDEWRNSNIIFHLYGDGTDKQYLEKLVLFYGLKGKVIIEGFKERRDIWKNCHCLLMCSHIEGTPLTVLEAMIAGRVCIVTNVGGNSEWINDGENGFLVGAPDKDLFSIKLKEALNRINEWESIGRKAHDTVIKKIDRTPGKTLLEKIETNEKSTALKK